MSHQFNKMTEDDWEELEYCAGGCGTYVGRVGEAYCITCEMKRVRKRAVKKEKTSS